jgi:acyl-CoA thioesterase
MTAPESDLKAQEIAQAMYDLDYASQHLGVELLSVTPGHATLRMPLVDWMFNGHGTCHGGIIFMLADTAFAYSCNSYNLRTVAQQCSITFLAPGRPGEVLLAEAKEVARAGRSGIYDIEVRTEQGEVLAQFRGNSRTISGTVIPE